MTKLYDANAIKLAELKYYSKENNGVEVSLPVSLGVFICLKDRWFNIFDVADDAVIFERLKCYGNVTSTGLEYGSKLRMVSDEEKDVSGPCWILSDKTFSKIIGKEKVSYEEIEDYILCSQEYFKDRSEIARKRIFSFREPTRMINIIRRDKKNKNRMDQFFDERGQAIQKVKKG